MFNVEKYQGKKEENYTLVQKQLIALIEDEPNQIANLSNASALLNQFLDKINWVGFYLVEGKRINTWSISRTSCLCSYSFWKRSLWYFSN